MLQAVDRVVAELDVQPVQVHDRGGHYQRKARQGLGTGGQLRHPRRRRHRGNRARQRSGAERRRRIPARHASSPRRDNSWAAPTSGLAEAQHGLKFGYVSNSVTGFIRALQTCHESRSSPPPVCWWSTSSAPNSRLGDRLGYETATQTQTSTVQTVQFMDIGTQLRLRPFVASDGMMRMEIHPENSTGALDQNGIPQTSAAQVTTNVMVPDGTTVVIGGLIENDRDVQEAGIPLLSSLPWIGFLFRQTVDKPTRRELIVILTPHIWNQRAAMRLNGVQAPECIDAVRAQAGISCDSPPRGECAE